MSRKALPPRDATLPSQDKVPTTGSLKYRSQLLSRNTEDLQASVRCCEEPSDAPGKRWPRGSVLPTQTRSLPTAGFLCSSSWSWMLGGGSTQQGRMDAEPASADMALGKLRDPFLLFPGGNRLPCEGRPSSLTETQSSQARPVGSHCWTQFLTTS